MPRAGETSGDETMQSSSAAAARADALSLLGERAAHLTTQHFDAIAAAMAVEQDSVDAGGLLADEGLRRNLVAANRDQVIAVTQALASEQWATPELTTASIEVVRTLARRGAQLSAVLRLFRTGTRFLRARFGLVLLDDIADDALRAALAALLWDRSALYLDVTMDAVVAEYESERERWVTGALARRAETVQELLRGAWVDVDEASLVLGHELRRHHTALVLWRQQDSGNDGLRRLEARVAEAAGLLGATRALTLPAGADSVWAWVATSEPPAGDVLEALGEGDGSRVAAGTPGFGPEGFCRSHREAVLAQRVALRRTCPVPLTRFEEVELLTLVSGDDAAMTRFVRRELGPLGLDDPAAARLRATLAAVQASGGSSAAAADALGIHRNTVLYRLRRIEELLGRSPASRRIELELALLLADQFPERVLESPHDA